MNKFEQYYDRGCTTKFKCALKKCTMFNVQCTINRNVLFSLCDVD